MKNLINIAALVGLLLGSASAFAAEPQYGPVLKVKPQGVAEAAESKPTPAAPQNVKKGQSPKPVGLLLPAVQKAQDAGSRGNAAQDEGIQGSLDRDIIRRIPGAPKPKPKP